MTENELFTWIIANLEPLMREFGGPQDMDVVRAYQTSQQGRTEGAAIYIARQDLKQYGSPRDAYERDPENPRAVRRINSQVMILRIQFQASITYDPNTGLRVGDLLNLASRIMGMPRWRNLLLGIGVQMLRIETNGMTYVMNDRDQYEAVPVLFVDFSYTETIVDSSPVVDTVGYKIKRV